MTLRNNNYLEQRLRNLWHLHFSDIPQSNEVKISFGRKAKRRLGSIRRCHYTDRPDFDTLIYINGHFVDESIPGFVIDATICHELAHYAHGFSSPLPRLSRFPHRGGIVDRELKKRGLEHLVTHETIWLQKNWLKYLDQK